MDEVVEDVGHAQWVFTIPKMLRVYFLYHRELLGELSRAAAETAKELLAAAAGEEGFRSGIVSVVQTFGDRANFHPHVHALVTRGGWTVSGEWIPVPYVDEGAAHARVVAAQRLLRSQPGLCAPWGWPGLRSVGEIHDALAREPDEAAFHAGRQRRDLRPQGRT
jgi:hypothetical protein